MVNFCVTHPCIFGELKISHEVSHVTPYVELFKWYTHHTLTVIPLAHTTLMPRGFTESYPTLQCLFPVCPAGEPSPQGHGH